MVGGEFYLFLLTRNNIQLVVTLLQFSIDALDLSSHVAGSGEDATFAQLVTITGEVGTSRAERISRSPTTTDCSDSAASLFVLQLMKDIDLRLIGAAGFLCRSHQLFLLIDGALQPGVRLCGEFAHVLFDVQHFALHNLDLVGDSLIFLAQFFEFRATLAGA